MATISIDLIKLNNSVVLTCSLKNMNRWMHLQDLDKNKSPEKLRMLYRITVDLTNDFVYYQKL
jgi:hypothetical protein